MTLITQVTTSVRHIADRPDTCHSCEYYGVGGGWCPDAGDPLIALLAFVLEGPGSDEVVNSVPLSGATGRVFDRVLLPVTGVARDRCVIGNTLRCRPPANKYPVGKLKEQAEARCRQYDTKIHEFKHTCIGVTFHPASLFRTPNYRKYILRTMERAGELVRQGERPLVLMGVRSMNVFAPWLKGGVKRWVGHFERSRS